MMLSPLSDVGTYEFFVDLMYVMALYKIGSLPKEIVEEWPSFSVKKYERLVGSKILNEDEGFLKLNTIQYTKINSAFASLKGINNLPNEITRSFGPPWTQSKCWLLRCRPRLDEFSLKWKEPWHYILSECSWRSANGIGANNLNQKAVSNVIVKPVFHERDFLQHPKVRRAIRHYNPNAIAIEATSPSGTRHILSTLLMPRFFMSLSYCVALRQYVGFDDRIQFLMDDNFLPGTVKVCVTPENDLAAVAGTSLSLAIPFFSIGVPEESVVNIRPLFADIEKKAWYSSCMKYEATARNMYPQDLDVLCNESKIAEMEQVLEEGRNRTRLEYKKQLEWVEDYMASRLFDFYRLTEGTCTVLVFVGICHSKALRQKLATGEWQYIPPIPENLKKTGQGFKRSKVAAYAIFEDQENINFMGRFERAISPSPIHSELFGFSDGDILTFVEKNMAKVILSDQNTDGLRRHIMHGIQEFSSMNPDDYKKLRQMAREEMLKMN